LTMAQNYVIYNFGPGRNTPTSGAPEAEK
jgi:hypothetical protein